jgi:hypothetical protein
VTERCRIQDLWLCDAWLPATQSGRVATYRVVEQEDGSWSCRQGRDELDCHAQLDDAIEHTTGIARANLPSQVFVHHRDGRMSAIAMLH